MRYHRYVTQESSFSDRAFATSNLHKIRNSRLPCYAERAKDVHRKTACEFAVMCHAWPQWRCQILNVIFIEGKDDEIRFEDQSPSYHLGLTDDRTARYRRIDHLDRFGAALCAQLFSSWAGSASVLSTLLPNVTESPVMSMRSSGCVRRLALGGTKRPQPEPGASCRRADGEARRTFLFWLTLWVDIEI